MNGEALEDTMALSNPFVGDCESDEIGSVCGNEITSGKVNLIYPLPQHDIVIQ